MRRFLGSGINTGVAAGIIWGWVCMAVNAATGIFPFEGTFTHNVVTFSAAGAVFGIVTSALLLAGGRFIPFRNAVARGMLVSTVLWLVMRFVGNMLSVMEPERYHLLKPEFIQGVTLAVVLGALLGLLGRRVFGARA